MDVLLVFARFPEVGKCKTRLISELGPEGAAEVHSQMTDWTLNWARELSAQDGTHIEVHCTGGSLADMAERFGSDLSYVHQVSGDLGHRMLAAIKRHLAQPPVRVVVVGTDCPQLSAKFVRRAFARLSAHDVCIAPAADGGYALLGLSSRLDPTSGNSVCSRIFQNIQWGSEHVLAQTLTQLKQTNAGCSLLPTLADVDVPSDLPVWQTAIGGCSPPNPKLSVVIPALNEEPELPRVVEAANIDARTEVIIAGAGRSEFSLHVASQRCAQYVHSPAGRAQQMNAGAELASGEIILFLHADTILPANYVDQVLNVLNFAEDVAGGAFSLRINSPRRTAKLIELGVDLRSRFRHLPYGDQAIFVRIELFRELGGFKSLPIMEDYEFIRRLRRRGRIRLAPAHVVTSCRRWERLGYLKTTIINQIVLAGYHLGVSPASLARFYRRQ